MQLLTCYLGPVLFQVSIRGISLHMHIKCAEYASDHIRLHPSYFVGNGIVYVIFIVIAHSYLGFALDGVSAIVDTTNLTGSFAVLLQLFAKVLPTEIKFDFD